MRESNSHQRFWRPLSYHLTNPLFYEEKWLLLVTSHWKGFVPSKLHTCYILMESFFQPCDCWSSPHPISNSQLRALLHFHLCPIYLVVFKGVYFFRMGHLILRGASRLDAFSVYLFRTWLPGRRLGSLTGTPAVRPSRSSRTKDSSSQISYAHAG